MLKLDDDSGCATQMLGYVDMTGSDFFAAFLLASQLQRCRRKAALRVSYP